VSKQSLLLVDGDTRSLRVLEVSLRKAGFMVTAASSVQDALGKLELHAPDLIISETTFPDGDGFELRRRVRATPEWSEIPFIFLTAEAAIENKIRGLELGVDDYLTKPIYIKEIVTRINILLQKRQRVRFEERRDGRTRFAGRVQDMPVVDVIQTIEISRKSGVIQFVGERGRQAAIYFRDGRVIDAEAGALQGEDAVYRLLTWSEGEFEVVFRTVRRREVITMSSQGLLMEGMRRLDEWSRLFEQLPPLTHRFEVDTIELAGRLGDVPDDNNRILRLFDGKRTLLEVIDASDVGDLECLQAISRLYFEELLLDLDHEKAPRREPGKPMQLVELDGPTAVDDAISGPMSLGPVAGSDDEAAGEAPSDLDEPRPDASQDDEPPAATASEGDEADAGSSEDEASFEEHRGGPLMGGYRQSSLRLIDEAVAAAQAIEPSLFDDAHEPPSPPHGGAPGPNGVSRGAPGADSAVDGGHQAPLPDPPMMAPESPVRARSGDREESGLRMIGSLGRDRAEASGELAPLGQVRPKRSETARELVTILPRRVTREIPAMTAELIESLAQVGATPSVVVESPVVAPAIEIPAMPPTPLRVPLPGTGVHTLSRSRRLLRLMRSVDGTGPGLGALLLIFLAAVLAVTAVVLRLRRHAKPAAQIETASAGERTLAMAERPGAAPGTVEPSGAPSMSNADVAEAPARDERPGDGSDPASSGDTKPRLPGAKSAQGAEAGAPPAPASATKPAVMQGATPTETGAPRSSLVREALPAEIAVGRGSAAGTTGSMSGASAPAGADATPSEAGRRGSAAGAAITEGTTGEAPGSGRAVRPDSADKVGEAKLLSDKAHDALDDGNPTRALELADASLRLRKTARTYLLRAQAEHRLGRVDAALISVDAAARIAPDFAMTWELRGRILWAAQRRDEARASFEKFLALEPGNPKAAAVRRLLNEPR